MSRSRCAGPLALALLLALQPLAGCKSVGHTLEIPEAQPPMAELVAPPSYLTPRSQRYRVAVRPFVDRTGKASGLTDAAADVLLTALQSRDRFSLYDARALTSPELPAVSSPPPAVSSSPPALQTTLESVDPSLRGDVYASLEGMVDGVLESYVTAVRLDAQGSGRMEVDYRIVDPYSRMVVTSGSASIGVSRGAVVRRDFDRMASAASRPFIDPGVMDAHEVVVREVSLRGSEVKLTLDSGSEKQVERGFVGFVVEPDRYARVDRYLAKFVVVSVFPDAAVAVVVDHCNAVGRCAKGQGIPAVEQAQNVHVGSRVRFK